MAMAEARHKAEWARTCEIVAMIYNMHRSKDSPQRSGKDFLDRILGRKKPAPPPMLVLDDLSILETVFVKGQKPDLEKLRSNHGSV
jgi:hypothetical protein